MIFESVNCPNCSGALEGVESEGFYKCPYCSSIIRVTFSSSSENRRSDGRTIVYDEITNEQLCYLLLGKGWTARGRVYNVIQSADWPFSIRVRAESPNKDAVIEYVSGSSFKEIKAGMVPHIEGQFDQGDMRPLKRMVAPSQYADSYMKGILGNNIILREKRPFPVNPPINFSEIISNNRRQTEMNLASVTPYGMWSRVDDVIHAASTDIYDYSANQQNYTAAAAVLIDGVTLSMGAPGLIFSNHVTYTLWSVQHVITLACKSSKFEDYYENLVMFCSSMQAVPELFTKMENARMSINRSLMQGQQARYDAHMNMMKQQQASFEAYNKAWFENSDRRHGSARNAAHSTQSAMDRIFDKYSEATRGVDTYIRPDGTEVEYSVVNEAAFASATDSRTTFATQQKDFRSIDWVEMKKKY